VEALAARRRFAQTVENISIWAGAVGPTVLAGCTLTGGIVLLFSNAAPVSEARLRLVETMLPLTVIETSHLMGSIAGVLLLLLAYGVQQGLRWAWTLSAVLLCAGAVSAMLKGFAWEEAVALAVLLFALLPARREFHLASSPPSRYAFDWFVAVAVVLTTALWLGLFSYKHLDAAEWWRFTLYGNASRFLRASTAVAIVALGAAGYRLLSAVRYRRTTVLC
jgi:phosphatidylglycerol lysyltransferase